MAYPGWKYPDKSLGFAEPIQRPPRPGFDGL